METGIQLFIAFWIPDRIRDDIQGVFKHIPERCGGNQKAPLWGLFEKKRPRSDQKLELNAVVSIGIIAGHTENGAISILLENIVICFKHSLQDV